MPGATRHHSPSAMRYAFAASEECPIIRPAALLLLLAMSGCTAPEATPPAEAGAPYTGPPVAGLGGSAAGAGSAEAACTRRVRSIANDARLVRVDLPPGEAGTIHYAGSAGRRYVCFVNSAGEIANVARLGGRA